MRRKKVVWQPNDTFTIQLMNKKYAVGHILDQRMVNTVRIALYKELIDNPEQVDIERILQLENLISLIEVTREQLDYGVWKIAGNKATVFPVDKFANEQFRSVKWVNSIVHDAVLAEDFLNSYHGFLPWDDWFDPNYLDSFLIDPCQKPDNILYKNSLS